MKFSKFSHKILEEKKQKTVNTLDKTNNREVKKKKNQYIKNTLESV
jgi:hypothetical protein